VSAFYLDNDVSNEVIGLLETKGHDVLHTRRHGQARASDDQQLLTALRLNRILVTHNAKDFGLVHRAWRLWPGAFGAEWPQHPGILVVPQPADLSTPRVAAPDRFVRSGRPLLDQLYRLTAAGVWQRER
jgi:hypothetical protein